MTNNEGQDDFFQNYSNKPQNDAVDHGSKTAFLGALIGGLVGLVAALILSNVGFISSLTAYLGVWLGAKLYRKFGGKADKKMIVTVTVTTFVCMVLSVFVSYYIVAILEYKELCETPREKLNELDLELVDGTLWDYYKYLLTSSEGIVGWVGDLVMTILFTVIGTVSEVKKMKAEIAKQKQEAEAAKVDPFAMQENGAPSSDVSSWNGENTDPFDENK